MRNDDHFFLHRDGMRVTRTLFDPRPSAHNGRITAKTGVGRGPIIFFQHDNHSLVLRHYRRGGLPARFSADKYLWLGLERTRAWREYRLLECLRARQLPAPRVYAAHIKRCGLFYTGDIITYRIAQTATLGERLAAGPVPTAVFARIGGTIRRFHDALVDHVDLNADNILLDCAAAVYLIDFDRCRMRSSAVGNWRQGNLRRLRRSLDRLSGDEPAWDALCRGYRNQALE